MIHCALEPSYTTSELLESSNALLPQALNRIRDTVAQQLQQQQQNEDSSTAGSQSSEEDAQSAIASSDEVPSMDVGDKAGGGLDEARLRANSSAVSAEQAEIELMTKIQVRLLDACHDFYFKCNMFAL